MNNLLTGGILVTLLVGLWVKVKSVLWYFGRLFLVNITAPYLLPYAKYYWDHLKNHKFITPIYSSFFYGSGAESKIFYNVCGATHYKLMRIKKRWVLAKMDNDGKVKIISFKCYVGYDEIYEEISNYYSIIKKEQQMDDNPNSSRFQTTYVRGTINSGLGKNNKDDDAAEPNVGSPIQAHGTFYVPDLESFNIGRRVNYTKDEYLSMVTFHKQDKKLLDYLYLTKEMEILKNKIELWFRNKEWFIERGIQWKRGALLHGPPGTGKTSFIVALAEYFKIPLHIFDLSTFTNEDLEEQWNNLKHSTPCFVLFEDFDSVFHGRRHVEKSNNMMAKPVSFDCVLNILDGAVKFDGVATFITTNEIDKIDKALGGGSFSRPGRIDYVCEMESLSKEGRRFIAESIIYGFEGAAQIRNNIINSDEDMTPAQFKDKCIDLALSGYEEIEKIEIKQETQDKEKIKHIEEDISELIKIDENLKQYENIDDNIDENNVELSG